MLRNARGGGVVVTNGAEPQAVLDELSNEIDRLNKENAALRQRIQLLTHRLFGRRSEKGVPVVEQGVLPFEPVVAGRYNPRPRMNHGRTNPPNVRLSVGVIQAGVAYPPICHANKSSWSHRPASGTA